MKFTVLQPEFAKALAVVSKAISAKASLPILSNVLIQSDKGRLKLSATDLDKSITTWLGAKIDEEGAITVPAKTLLEFVSNMSPTQLEVVVENNVLHLKSQKANSSFNGIDASEFPLPQISVKSSFSAKVGIAQFFNALSETAFSSASEESRPILTGVLLNFEGSEITFAAVDGFRLSEKKVEVKNKSKEQKSVVVSAKTLLELARTLQGVNKNAEITISLLGEENLVALESEEILCSLRILEGNFPDYKKIIPADTPVHISVSQSDLLGAVRAANIFASMSTNVVKIEVDPSKGLGISGEAQEVGQNKTEVDAEIKGEKMEIMFDVRFLMDFLNNVKGETVLIEGSGPLDPFIFKIRGKGSYLHIIMPRRP